MPIVDSKQVQDSRRILELSQREPEEYGVTVCGRQFIVLPGVFSPKYFDSTRIFSEQFPFRPHEDFLEVGCGTGVTSVLAALNGAQRILAVDINPVAVENTRINATLHGVGSVVESRVSDLFSAVPDSDQFDTIYWNTNFIYVEPDYEYQSALERALYDPGYRYHDRFLAHAPRYLRSGGRLILGFGDFGDSAELRRLCATHHFQMKEISRDVGEEGRPVTFILYELVYEVPSNALHPSRE
jgi:release factor glutamine methyltransferase